MLSEENHARTLKFLFERKPDFSLLSLEEFENLNYRIELEKVKKHLEELKK